MKKNILLPVITSAVLAFSTVFTASPAFSESKDSNSQNSGDRLKDAEHYFTSNGIEVILKKIDTNDIVGLKLFVKGGVRSINSKNAGIEKLLFNTMLKGSKEFSKDKLNVELAGIGAQIGTDSYLDFSSFNLKSVNKYFDRALYIFQDLINHPLLEQGEIELEKSFMVSALKHKMDDPDEYIWKLVNRSYAPGHPYSLSVDGEMDTIPVLDHKSLEKHMKENLIGSKMLLVVVGNFNDNLRKDIEKYFGKFPKGNYKNTPVPVIKSDKSDIVFEERKIPTAYIAGRFKAPSIKDKDYPATYLALRILSQKIYESVRTKHGLSYAVYAGNSMRQENSGYVYVTTAKPNETIKLIYDDINALKKNPVSKKQLQGVQNLYYTQYFMDLETNLGQADNMGMNHLISGDYRNSYKLIEEFRKVTPEEVKTSVNKYVKNIRFGIIYHKELIDEKLFKSM